MSACATPATTPPWPTSPGGRFCEIAGHGHGHGHWQGRGAACRRPLEIVIVGGAWLRGVCAHLFAGSRFEAVVDMSPMCDMSGEEERELHVLVSGTRLYRGYRDLGTTVNTRPSIAQSLITRDKRFGTYTSHCNLDSGVPWSCEIALPIKLLRDQQRRGNHSNDKLCL